MSEADDKIIENIGRIFLNIASAHTIFELRVIHRGTSNRAVESKRFWFADRDSTLIRYEHGLSALYVNEALQIALNELYVLKKLSKDEEELFVFLERYVKILKANLVQEKWEGKDIIVTKQNLLKELNTRFVEILALDYLEEV